MFTEKICQQLLFGRKILKNSGRERKTQMSGKKGGKKALHLYLENWNSHRQEVSERKEAFSFKWQISLLDKTYWQDVVFMPSTGGPFPGTICVSTNRFPQRILKNLVVYCFVTSTRAADSSFYIRVVIWTTASCCGGSSAIWEGGFCTPSISSGHCSLTGITSSLQGCQTYLRHCGAVHIPTCSLNGLIKKTTGVTKKLQEKQTQMPFCYIQQYYFNHGDFWCLPPTVVLSVLHIQVEPQIPQENQMLSTCPVLWVTSLFIDFHLYSLGHSLWNPGVDCSLWTTSWAH